MPSDLKPAAIVAGVAAQATPKGEVRRVRFMKPVPKVLSNGANGVEDGKIMMEGLVELPFDFSKPYSDQDCTRYAGATASNCPGGGRYHSPYGGGQ